MRGWLLIALAAVSLVGLAAIRLVWAPSLPRYDANKDTVALAVFVTVLATLPVAIGLVVHYFRSGPHLAPSVFRKIGVVLCLVTLVGAGVVSSGLLKQTDSRPNRVVDRDVEIERILSDDTRPARQALSDAVHWMYRLDVDRIDDSATPGRFSLHLVHVESATQYFSGEADQSMDIVKRRVLQHVARKCARLVDSVHTDQLDALEISIAIEFGREHDPAGGFRDGHQEEVFRARIEPHQFEYLVKLRHDRRGPLHRGNLFLESSLDGLEDAWTVVLDVFDELELESDSPR